MAYTTGKKLLVTKPPEMDPPCDRGFREVERWLNKPSTFPSGGGGGGSTAPVVEYVNPTQGASGTTINLFGYNLSGVTLVNFVGTDQSGGNHSATATPSGTTPTQVTVVVPSLPLGLYNVFTAQPGQFSNGVTFVIGQILPGTSARTSSPSFDITSTASYSYTLLSAGYGWDTDSYIGSSGFFLQTAGTYLVTVSVRFELNCFTDRLFSFFMTQRDSGGTLISGGQREWVCYGPGTLSNMPQSYIDFAMADHFHALSGLPNTISFSVVASGAGTGPSDNTGINHVSINAVGA